MEHEGTGVWSRLVTVTLAEVGSSPDGAEVGGTFVCVGLRMLPALDNDATTWALLLLFTAALLLLLLGNGGGSVDFTRPRRTREAGAVDFLRKKVGRFYHRAEILEQTLEPLVHA